MIATVTARKALGAWNGFLHAGAVVSLADTCCGYGTVRSLPAGAIGFTTVRSQEQLLRQRRARVFSPFSSFPSVWYSSAVRR